MSSIGQNIKSQINQWVRNYAVEAFQNMRLNSILLQLVDWIDGAGGGGSGGGGATLVVALTSANFVNVTDCPITSMAGGNIAVFFNEGNRYLNKDQGEWTDLPGGGFRVLIPNFNAASANYHFYAVLDGIGSQVLLVQKKSADFSNSTDCPIPSLNGRNIAIYMNEVSRFLEKDAGEWQDLLGGGFRILLNGFNASSATYHFYIYVL